MHVFLATRPCLFDDGYIVRYTLPRYCEVYTCILLLVLDRITYSYFPDSICPPFVSSALQEMYPAGDAYNSFTEKSYNDEQSDTGIFFSYSHCKN